VRLAIEKVAKAKAYTTEEGSRFLVQAALLLSDDQEAEQSLRDTYFDSGALTDVSAFSTSEDGQQLQRRVWVSVAHIAIFKAVFLTVMNRKRLWKNCPRSTVEFWLMLNGHLLSLDDVDQTLLRTRYLHLL